MLQTTGTSRIGVRHCRRCAVPYRPLPIRRSHQQSNSGCWRDIAERVPCRRSSWLVVVVAFRLGAAFAAAAQMALLRWADQLVRDRLASDRRQSWGACR
jgi:hypothetical protein